ncbi:unnamed protein product [Durusdinium trenchii]|uniref:1-aminocyclopropane-1-carboxylate oxidase-like 7 n=2 Tax=Durusdinium trenchii TaxID=1381693 RepID=A0ABP0HVV9_9DINO
MALPVVLPSASDCIKEFDLDGDGLLSHSELGTCLEVLLTRLGSPDEEARRISRLIVEEWSLRSDYAAGAGAVDRLLRAAMERTACVEKSE